jgi:hypothetical protein
MVAGAGFNQRSGRVGSDRLSEVYSAGTFKIDSLERASVVRGLLLFEASLVTVVVITVLIIVVPFIFVF